MPAKPTIDLEIWPTELVVHKETYSLQDPRYSISVKYGGTSLFAESMNAGLFSQHIEESDAAIYALKLLKHIAKAAFENALRNKLIPGDTKWEDLDG